jgi:prepilin peptidase CpaA
MRLDLGLTLPPPGVEALLLAVVLGAAVYDVRYRRIPNWLSLGGVLLGLALNTFLYQGWPGLSFSLIGMAAGFGVYFLLYALRAMGAGDVKLMAAVGAIVGWRDWFGMFLITAVIGGVMALILVARRGRVKKTLWNVSFILNEMKSGRAAYVGKEELDVRNPKALGLPHGAVIAVGAIFFLALSAHFTQ